VVLVAYRTSGEISFTLKRVHSDTDPPETLGFNPLPTIGQDVFKSSLNPCP